MVLQFFALSHLQVVSDTLSEVDSNSAPEPITAPLVQLFGCFLKLLSSFFFLMFCIICNGTTLARHLSTPILFLVFADASAWQFTASNSRPVGTLKPEVTR